MCHNVYGLKGNIKFAVYSLVFTVGVKIGYYYYTFKIWYRDLTAWLVIHIQWWTLARDTDVIKCTRVCLRKHCHYRGVWWWTWQHCDSHETFSVEIESREIKIKLAGDQTKYSEFNCIVFYIYSYANIQQICYKWSW